MLELSPDEYWNLQWLQEKTKYKLVEAIESTGLSLPGYRLEVMNNFTWPSNLLFDAYSLFNEKWFRVNEYEQVIMTIIHNLPTEYRDILIKRYKDGLTYKELTNWNDNNAFKNKCLINRGLLLMRKYKYRDKIDSIRTKPVNDSTMILSSYLEDPVVVRNIYIINR